MLCLTDKAKSDLVGMRIRLVVMLISLLMVAYAFSLAFAIQGTLEITTTGSTVGIYPTTWMYSCILQLPVIALGIQQFGKWLYNSFERC